MDRRLGRDEHRAYLQPMPDGGFLVIVVAEGPRADGFPDAAAASEHEFDRWFIEKVTELHALDPSAAGPPLADRKI